MTFIIQNIWWILIAAIVVLGGAAWLMFVTRFGHQLMDSLRPNTGKHIKALVFCEDKQIRDRKCNIDTYCITIEPKHSSFKLIHDLLLTSNKTGNQFLCLNERDTNPIDFTNKLGKEDYAKYPNAVDIYVQTANDLDNQITGEDSKSMMGMSVSIVVLGLAVIFCVIAILVFWGGKG